MGAGNSGSFEEDTVAAAGGNRARRNKEGSRTFSVSSQTGRPAKRVDAKSRQMRSGRAEAGLSNNADGDGSHSRTSRKRRRKDAA